MHGEPAVRDGGLSLQFPDNLFGFKLGVRLGRRIIRRHKAGSRPAPDENTGMRIRGYSRAPVPRSALVGDNRILRYVGHVASEGRLRALYSVMSTAALAQWCHIARRARATTPFRTSNPSGIARSRKARCNAAMSTKSRRVTTAIR